MFLMLVTQHSYKAGPHCKSSCQCLYQEANKEHFIVSPWMGCYSTEGPPSSRHSAFCRRYPFIQVSEERHCERKVFCPKTQPRPGLGPGQLELEFSALTIRSPCMNAHVYKHSETLVNPRTVGLFFIKLLALKTYNFYK